MIKTVAKTLMVAAGAITVYGFYGHRKYQQSATSFLLEKSMRAVGYRDRIRTEDPENFAAGHINHPDADSFPSLLLGNPHYREFQVEGMQVFAWNEGSGGALGKKIILYLHGGGYVYRASRLHYWMINQVACESGASVVFPIYGLGPRHSVWTQLPKIQTLYNQLVAEHAAENIVVMGDSAGGGLAVALLQALRRDKLHMPRRLILLSPWVNADLTNFMIPYYDAVEPMITIAGLLRAGRCWVGEQHDPRDPIISPVFLPPEEMSGWPPITSFAGTHELLLPDIRDFHQLLTRAGVENELRIAPRMIHVYPVFPTPEGREARQQIAQLVQL